MKNKINTEREKGKMSDKEKPIYAMTEEAKRARREYQKKYYDTHPEAREQKNAYAREWRPENKAKQAVYLSNYWERKAQEGKVNAESNTGN